MGVYNHATRRLTLSPVGGDTVVKLEPQTLYLTDAEVAGLNKPQGKPPQERPHDPVASRTDARK